MKLTVLNLALHLQEANDFFFRIDDIYLFVERTITYKILHIMKNYYYKQKFIIMDIMKFNTQALKIKK